MYQELLKEADSNIENYKRQNAELLQKNDELQRENEKFRSQVEQLNTVLSHQDSGDPESEDANDDVISEPEFDSVHQVVERAEKFMNGLRFSHTPWSKPKGRSFLVRMTCIEPSKRWTSAPTSAFTVHWEQMSRDG